MRFMHPSSALTRTARVALLLCTAILVLHRGHAQSGDPDSQQLAILRAKAEKGQAQAQSELGNALSLGQFGLATNYVEAVKWYRKAAEQNHVVAQVFLGACYAKGLGVTTNLAEAVNWFRKAAEQDNALAQNALGFCYASGQGAAKDPTEGVKWYRKAANQDDAQAQQNLGYCYYNGEGVERDYVEAVRWFRKASGQDYAPAQYQLGLCFYEGHGVAKDFAEAYAWWSVAARSQALAVQGLDALAHEMSPEQTAAGLLRAKDLRAQIEARLPDREVLILKAAAAAGDATAQSGLGVRYAFGRGVMTNVAEAVKWWRKAAAQNDAIAQCSLGVCYSLGRGLEKDYAEAVKWYRKAAGQNLPEGEYSLGACYEQGQGVVEDGAEAVKWFRKAAEQDHAQAQINLGVHYVTGLGVAKDEVEAYKWWFLAGEQGEEVARRNLTKLEGELTREQVAEGKRRADEWLKAQKTPPLKTRATRETVGWGDAKVTKTDLLTGATNRGKFVYSFASVMTRAGCHVAKVEGERGKEVFVRLDGPCGKPYADIAHPVFSPDGSALAYAVRGAGGSFFVINEHEGPEFEEVIPDTFVFSGDGKRHAYLAKKAGRVVAVIDGKPQAEGESDFAPWLQPPLFSPSGCSVAYLENSARQKKMRAVVNAKPGELFDGVDPRSLRFSSDGFRFAYAANDRKEGSCWFWVIDGIKGKVFDELGVDFVFGPDAKRTAYTGKKGSQWFVVVEGEPEVEVEGIVDNSLTFSPDSRRLAYAVAKLDGRSYIVVDGEAGAIYDGIGLSTPRGLNPSSASGLRDYHLGGLSQGVLFSPDSRRLAYLAHKRLVKRMVVLDGKSEEVEMDFMVGGMVFSSDSKRLAYGGRRGDKFFLVVDGKRGVDYDALGHFEFSSDGKHIAFTARKGDKMVIVVDGQERAEHSEIPAGPVFRSDGVLEYLAADEPSVSRIEVRGF